jgi:hypothetical protein
MLIIIYGEDIFKIMQNFVDKGLRQTELVGMCIDGAPSMMGIHSGFLAHIK